MKPQRRIKMNARDVATDSTRGLSLSR